MTHASNTTPTAKLQGVIFRRNIRASFASCDIIRTESELEDEHKKEIDASKHVIVLIQFRANVESGGSEHPDQEQKDDDDSVLLWKRNLRHVFKLGNYIQVEGGYFLTNLQNRSTANESIIQEGCSDDTFDRCTPRYILHPNYSILTQIQLVQTFYWNMNQCQQARIKCYPLLSTQDTQSSDHPVKLEPMKDHVVQHVAKVVSDARNDTRSTNRTISSTVSDKKSSSRSMSHAGGVGKRRQGEIVADFLLCLLTMNVDRSENYPNRNNNNKNDSEQANVSSSRFVTVPKSPLQQQAHDRDSCNHVVIQRYKTIIDSLNSKSGVLDVCGGSGHVSLALSIRGIKSTVIDPRERVGQLPNRDRKFFRKIMNRWKTDQSTLNMYDRGECNESLKSSYRTSVQENFLKENNSQESIAQNKTKQEKDRALDEGEDSEQIIHTSKQEKNRKLDEEDDSEHYPEDNDGTILSSNHLMAVPPIEYSSLRAWFLSHPPNVDEQFRAGSSNSFQDRVDKPSTAPICSVCSDGNLLLNCTFLVALHPDEATGDIVDFAVQYQIPFLVVPCCVFSRLYPSRFKPFVSSLPQDILSTILSSNMTLLNHDGDDSTSIRKEEISQNEQLAQNEKVTTRRQIVSTYYDLIEYLLDKDESIRISKLDFDGANLVLWSLFDRKFE